MASFKSPSSQTAAVKAAGLTIIELLVSIVVIVALLALILPVISAGRKSAQNARCLANLKQVGVGILRFANDHQGRILPSKLSDEARAREPGNPKPSGYWDIRLENEGYIPGPMVDGVPLNATLFCPSFIPNGHPTERHLIYGLRDWRGTIARTGEYLRLTQITSLSRFFLLSDSITEEGGHQWYTIQSEGGANGVHLRHYGRANTFFADGHVAPMEASYFKALEVSEPEFTRRPFKVFSADQTLL